MIKKSAIALIIVLLLISTLAMASEPSTDEEILFRGIPWGSSTSRVKQELEFDRNFISGQNFSTGIPMMPWNPFSEYRAYDAGYWLLAYPKKDILFVAGYPVYWIYVKCAYSYNGNTVYRDPNDAVLYSAGYRLEVADGEIVYEDIKQKLTTLYGDPSDEYTKEGSMIASPNYDYYKRYTFWYGDNNTAVYLYRCLEIFQETKSVKDDVIDIVYGKTDSEEYLVSLDAAILNEKKEEDKKRQIENDGNTDGL